MKDDLAEIGVTGVLLFGSVARGDDTRKSDIDIALETVDENDWMIDANARRLLAPLMGRKVDVTAMPLYGPVASTAPEDLVRVY